MRTQRERRAEGRVRHTADEVAHDMELAGDSIRRRFARELRNIGPMLVRASEKFLRSSQTVATSMSHTAEKIDGNLRREGKRPSSPPPPPTPRGA